MRASQRSAPVGRKSDALTTSLTIMSMLFVCCVAGLIAVLVMYEDAIFNPKSVYCSDSECSFHGNCHVTATGHLCSCKPGFTDSHCETEINECATTNCRNGATCLDGINEYKCLCAAGYTGITCDLEIKECASDPCGVNGDRCTDLVGGYRCTCKVGFTGATCDVALPIPNFSHSEEGGFLYMIGVSTVKSWDDTKQYCESLHPGAHLPEPSSKEKMLIYRNIVYPRGTSNQFSAATWTTGRKQKDDRNEWTWTKSGTSAIITDYDHMAGQWTDNGDCVFIQAFTGFGSDDVILGDDNCTSPTKTSGHIVMCVIDDPDL